MTRKIIPNIYLRVVRDMRLHGAGLRAAQIWELAQDTFPEIRCLEIDRPREIPRIDVILRLINPDALRAAIGNRLGIRARAAAAWIAQAMLSAGVGPGTTVLYDGDPIYGSSVAIACHAVRAKLVAFPHNIEALSFRAAERELSATARMSLLRAELEWLQAAETIWAIGEFDRNLLELFELPVRILPYWPTKERTKELLAVREARVCCEQSHLLILGTTGNPPTREGLQELFGFLKEMEGASGQTPIIVAGFGTETLSADAPRNVEVRGTQSWDGVRDLLAGARAVLAHQSRMTGALTRVTECLIAGVPVIANRWARIGLSEREGVYAYEDFSQLLALLNLHQKSVPVPDFSAERTAFMTSFEVRHWLTPNYGPSSNVSG